MFYIKMTDDKSLFEVDEISSVGWRGYRPRKGTYNQGYLSLDDAWNDKGLFLFAVNRPNIADIPILLKALEQYQRNERIEDDEIQFIWLSSTIINECKKLKIVNGTAGWKTKDNFDFTIGNSYSLSIPQKNYVEFKSKKMWIEITSMQGFDIKFVDKKVNKVYLPFGGKDSGAFRFSVKIYSDKIFSQKQYVGLKYFYFKKNGNHVDKVEQNYPIFEKQPNTEIDFYVSLDLLDPYNRTYEKFSDFGLRTYLAFNNVTELPSYFRTSFGHVVELSPDIQWDSNHQGVPRPLPGSGILILSPKYKISDFRSASYTVPHGHFFLSVNDTQPYEGAMRLLCGSSGTETISFSPKANGYPGDYMEFYRGKPAFWPSELDDSELKQLPQLTDDAYTSWIAVRPSRRRIIEAPGIIYSSQSEDDPHFRPLVEGVSQFYEPGIYDWTEDKDNSIPLVPLIGVQRDDSLQLKDAFELEWRGIASNRKMLMNQLSEQLIGVSNSRLTDGLSTTPQGLFVHETAGHWSELIIGQNIKNEVGSVTKLTHWDMLKFTNPSLAFRNALLSSRLFLVISMNSDKSPLWEKFDDLVTISGWPFKFKVPNRTNYQNIIIFKFCPGSLLEGIKQPGRWTEAEIFNEASQIENLSKWIRNYCWLDTSEENQVPPELIPFYRICRDPNWNGIIALNVDIDASQMPDELICLLGGIKSERLRAHHIGLNSNQVEWDDIAGLKMDKPSSLFGYIFYEDDVKVKWDSKETFKFRLTELKARFANTRIELFHAKIELLVRELYGNPVIISEYKGSGLSEPILTLFGTMELHEGVPTYIFQTEKPVLAILQKLKHPPILKSIRIDKVSFQTIDASDKNKIKTRFSFWGTKNFINNLAEDSTLDRTMDLFSYGDDNGIRGLLFGNLGITMSFDINDPINSSVFSFDVSQLSFDPEKSNVRSDSLANNYPLRLRKLVFVKDVDEWNSIGYREVLIPGSNVNSYLNGPWYGLEFAFDMGTLGKLLPESMLHGSLIASWNSNGEIYCGINIPGLDSVKNKGKLVLEEMLDLELPNDIQLILTDKGYQMSTNAAVRLFNKSYDIQFTILQPDNQKGQISWYLTSKI
jgi:hypothetical protein